MSDIRTSSEKPATADVDLYKYEVEEASFTQVKNTTVMYAAIDDFDAYAVRDASNPDAGELRLPGTAWRRLFALL